MPLEIGPMAPSLGLRATRHTYMGHPGILELHCRNERSAGTEALLCSASPCCPYPPYLFPGGVVRRLYIYKALYVKVKVQGSGSKSCPKRKAQG